MNKKNALLSVYNKEGIVEFAKELIVLGWTLYTSKGTGDYLRENQIDTLSVSKLVGGDPIFGHRVVTLSREVHAGLMAKDTPEDRAELERLGIPWIDLVCVDLYPIEEAIAKEGATYESVTEMTDIGGPTLLRAAAKGRRIVVCDSRARFATMQWLKEGCHMEALFRQTLAAKAERVVAEYCLASARFQGDGRYDGFVGKKITSCKYGENAYQAPAALYSFGTDDSLALDKFEVVEGTPPSYNNLADIDRMLQTITHIAAVSSVDLPFLGNIAVGVKHGNPCGAAVGWDSRVVLEKMMKGDQQAIFGGLIITNFRIDEQLSEVLAGKMLDGIVAPGFNLNVIERLRRKGDKCRFIKNPALADLGRDSLDRAPRFRYVRGGFLKQPNYTFVPEFFNGSMQKYGEATRQQVADMMLAWAVGSTSNSNAITLVKDGQLIGNGVGQQDRVGAAQLAINRAIRSGHTVEGAVAYSDSFFPFDDGPMVLITNGVKAIFTSSGSVKDKDTINLCKEYNVPLYMIPDNIGRGFFGH